MNRTKRGTWVDARTSELSGTTVLGIVDEIDEYALEGFEELLLHLSVTTALQGSSPTMDLYLQRAIRPNPDVDTDAHWADYYRVDQVGNNTLYERQQTWPVKGIAINLKAANVDSPVEQAGATLAMEELYVGHWHDRLRIVEKMGGTVTTAAVYSIYVTGRLGRTP